MIGELVKLGEWLQREGQLDIPVGFYEYRQPIRWIVHVWEGPPLRVYLEQIELHLARPYDGRTNAIRAHPVADEAGYVFGIGGRRSHRKHQAYLAQLDKLMASQHLQDGDTSHAVSVIKQVITTNVAKDDVRYRNIEEKDWVAFKFEDGPMANDYVHNMRPIQEFWADELGERLATAENREHPAIGECATCGRVTFLVTRVPKVRLQGMTPLHSLNTAAYVSYIDGPDPDKRAHVGMCYRCGDTAARAFNYLRANLRHHRELIRDAEKLDSLSNHFALYWLKKPHAPLEIGEVVIDWDEVLSSLGDVIREREITPEADITHIHNLVMLPWKPHTAPLNLDEYAFYLALVSPNVGRIAVREWLTVSVNALRQNLKIYLEALTITGAWGADPYPVSIRTAQWAIEAKPGEPLLRRQLRRIAKDTGIVRSLVRCAFKAMPPLPDILKQAVPRLRRTQAAQPKGERERHQQEQRCHALAAIIKLSLTYGKPEAQTMQTLDETHTTQPYLCGRLLAILERIQERAAWPKRLNTTVVDRAYGTASSAPASIFGKLLRGAEVGHLPRIRKENLGTYDWLKRELEEVHEQLEKAGGFPRTLPMQDQAEFALGFYCQRAHFRRGS